MPPETVSASDVESHSNGYRNAAVLGRHLERRHSAEYSPEEKTAILDGGVSLEALRAAHDWDHETGISGPEHNHIAR